MCGFVIFSFAASQRHNNQDAVINDAGRLLYKYIYLVGYKLHRVRKPDTQDISLHTNEDTDEHKPLSQ